MLRKFVLPVVFTAAVLGLIARAGTSVDQGQQGKQPWPVSAGGMLLDQTTITKFENCAATGSAGQSISNGTYFVTVMDETVTLCLLATCDGGYGTKISNGNAFIEKFLSVDGGGTWAGCLSSGATGDIYFTKTQSYVAYP